MFAASNLWLAEGFTARYGSVPLPFVALLVGTGVGALAARERWMGSAMVTALALLAGYSLVAWSNRPPLPESFWEPRALVSYLDRVATPGDAIVFTTPEQTGYYTL